MLSVLKRSFSRASGALKSRVAYAPFLEKVASAEDMIPLFKNGMYVGWSGFTPVGDPKAVPIALAEYVEKNKLQGKLRFNLFVGGSAGSYNEERWAKNQMTASRWPYQSSLSLRNQGNRGQAKLGDIHVSNFAQNMDWGFFTKERGGGLDIAIIEVTEVLPDGSLILAGAVGNVVEYARMADKIILEVNTATPSFRGCHDITECWTPPGKPYNITRVDDRIGTLNVKIDPRKVVGVVESRGVFPGRSVKGSDEQSRTIAGHIIDFFMNEVKHGRLPENLYPLQSGVGNIANAIIEGMNSAPFGNLEVFTEIVQEGMLPLFDSGKLRYASATAVTLSKYDDFYDKLDFYKSKFVLRNQGVSNSPEVIRRLGVIAMNTPVEFDIYAHANSSHASGSRVINGIGGSGDFERNAYLSIMHSPSARATKKDPYGISCVVPMCSHIDHTEHDLDVLVTEQGLADLRGLCPTDRAKLIIEKCVHPSYKDQMTEYLKLATQATQKRGAGHEPQILSKVFKMHVNLEEKGTMHLDSW